MPLKTWGGSSDIPYFRSRGCMDWYPSTKFKNTHIVYDSNHIGIGVRKGSHCPWVIYQCLEVIPNSMVELFLVTRLTSNPEKRGSSDWKTPVGFYRRGAIIHEI